jgi:predicted nucleic acid-binding protein
MALTHLADTSVLSRLGKAPVAAAVEPLVEAGALARTTMTDLEICFSARNQEEWSRLADALDVCAPIDIEASQFRRALAVQRLLAGAGHRGRKVSDLLIAAAAEQHRLSVLHYDADFDLISAVTGQPVEWVVPAGSVD